MSIPTLTPLHAPPRGLSSLLYLPEPSKQNFLLCFVQRTFVLSSEPHLSTTLKVSGSKLLLQRHLKLFSQRQFSWLREILVLPARKIFHVVTSFI